MKRGSTSSAAAAEADAAEGDEGDSASWTRSQHAASATAPSTGQVAMLKAFLRSPAQVCR